MTKKKNTNLKLKDEENRGEEWRHDEVEGWTPLGMKQHV